MRNDCTYGRVGIYQLIRDCSVSYSTWSFVVGEFLGHGEIKTVSGWLAQILERYTLCMMNVSYSFKTVLNTSHRPLRFHFEGILWRVAS